MWWATVALGASPPDLPPLPAFEVPTSPDGSCTDPVALTIGEPIPAKLVDEDGLVTCRGIVLGYEHALELQTSHEVYVPQLRARWLIDTRELQERYRLDTGALERERDWYVSRVEVLQKPPPLLERPGMQRTIGRVETLATVVAVGILMAGTARLVATP